LVSQIDWSVYIQNNPIVVHATSKKSQLSSTPTIQSICKKAITKKILLDKGGGPRSGGGFVNNDKVFEDPKLEPVEILIHLDNNECSILLNTTGESLHKR